MNPAHALPAGGAAIAQPAPDEIALSGKWTALGIGALERRLEELLPRARGSHLRIDGKGVEALDSAGVWVLQRMLRRLREQGIEPDLRDWPERFAPLLDLGAQKVEAPPPRPAPQPLLERVGRVTVASLGEAYGALRFVGEAAVAFAGCVANPARLRWRAVLRSIEIDGASALPIVGLLAFLLGIVVAYQGADQLRQYGANIFVADLVGWSMLREFAPLITAIIVAGRSGSAYAAQIGSMTVTEEIDAMRTIGISPIDLLVLPKIIGLVIALPLLTVFADVLGVFGGMIMAQAKLDVGFSAFLERFVNAIDVSTYLLGIAKTPVFAAIIAVVGCYQGFRTRGGADGVGRQTTRSVVQAIFLVIVADALFSIVFSILDL